MGTERTYSAKEEPDTSPSPIFDRADEREFF
jgi:hypothetical protein